MKDEALSLLFFHLAYSYRRTITGCLPSMQKLKILSIDFALKQRLASQTVFMVMCFFPFIWRLTWIQCHALPHISRAVSFLRLLWCWRELFLDSSGWVNTIYIQNLFCDGHNHSPLFSSTAIQKHRLIFKLRALSDCDVFPQIKRPAKKVYLRGKTLSEKSKLANKQTKAISSVHTKALFAQIVQLSAYLILYG